MDCAQMIVQPNTLQPFWGCQAVLKSVCLRKSALCYAMLSVLTSNEEYDR